MPNRIPASRWFQAVGKTTCFVFVSFLSLGGVDAAPFNQQRCVGLFKTQNHATRTMLGNNVNLTKRKLRRIIGSTQSARLKLHPFQLREDHSPTAFLLRTQCSRT